MKKHKRDGASSMESATSAAGSWCSQSRPQKGFIGSLVRLWNKTLKWSGVLTRHFAWTIISIFLIYQQ